MSSSWVLIGDGDKNLPSTYQQVVRNMRYIQDSVLPVINKLNATIFNTESDANSDVVWIPGADPDTGQMAVKGATIDAENIGTDDQPNVYARNVTFELKRAEAVGLSSKPEMSEYVTVVTVKAPAPDNHIWQCAYGDTGPASGYFRPAKSTTEWGDWEKINPKQIITSSSQPAPGVQNSGDFWLQLFKEGDLEFIDPDDPSNVEQLNTDTQSLYQAVDVDDPTNVEQVDLSQLTLMDLVGLYYSQDIETSVFVELDDNVTSTLDFQDATLDPSSTTPGERFTGLRRETASTIDLNKL